MQKATDQSKMDQISTFLERIDDDRDGQLKVDDLLKVNFGVKINLSKKFKFNAKLIKMFSPADLRNNWKREYQIEFKTN